MSTPDAPIPRLIAQWRDDVTWMTSNPERRSAFIECANALDEAWAEVDPILRAHEAQIAQLKQEVEDQRRERTADRLQLIGETRTREQAEADRTALRAALGDICDNAVGLPDDPLWIVSQEAIVRGRTVLNGGRDGEV